MKHIFLLCLYHWLCYWSWSVGIRHMPISLCFRMLVNRTWFCWMLCSLSNCVCCHCFMGSNSLSCCERDTNLCQRKNFNALQLLQYLNLFFILNFPAFVHECLLLFKLFCVLIKFFCRNPDVKLFVELSALLLVKTKLLFLCNFLVQMTEMMD